jgi:threonine dehydrogenase-like Zn-dependent dehydrogenase
MMQFMAKTESDADKLPVAQGSCAPKWSHTETMKAITYRGSSSLGMAKPVVYGDHPRPLLTNEKDAIVQVELSSISGCDLNMYSGELPTADKGIILGHEAVGVVVDVGAQVTSLQRGDRVVVALNMACGECAFCQRREFSECDATNDSKLFGDMFGGARGPAAIFGYSRLLGSVPGTQAEYLRVPFADVNCSHVPRSVSSEKALFASDVLASGLHAVTLGAVHEGDIVAVWGLGPVGLFAGKWAQLRGAKRVIGIDREPERLALAQEKFWFETIDRTTYKTTQQVVERLMEMLPLAKCSGGGVDVAIEAAGFRYAQATPHKLEQTLGMETDTADILSEMALCTRKCGRLAIVGDYVGTANHFPMGHIMQKHQQLKSGFVPVKKYFTEILEALEKGLIDPTDVVTHRMALEDAPLAYEKLFKQQDGYIKVVLKHAVP